MKSIPLKNQQAFTLIEVMVVISIIAVLTSILYASFGTVEAQTRDAKRAADSVQMRTALTAYSLDHGGVPAASTTASDCVKSQTNPPVWTCSTTDGVDSVLAPLVSGKYISSIPTDPLSSSGYSYYYSTGPSTSVDPVTGTPLAPSASFDYVSETQTASPNSPVVLGINVGTPDYATYPGTGYPSDAGNNSESSSSQQSGSGDTNNPPEINTMSDGNNYNDYTWFIGDGIYLTGTNLGGNPPSLILTSVKTGDQVNVAAIDDSGTSVFFYVPAVDTDTEGTSWQFQLINDNGSTAPMDVGIIQG